MRIEGVDQLRACLGHPNETTQARIYTRLTVQAVEFIGRSPLLIVATAEAYVQCGKALIRSLFWKSESWPTESAISFGSEIADNLGKDAAFASDLDARVKQRYCDSLY